MSEYEWGKQTVEFDYEGTDKVMSSKQMPADERRIRFRRPIVDAQGVLFGGKGKIHLPPNTVLETTPDPNVGWEAFPAKKKSPKPRVYIAAMFSQKLLMRRKAKELEKLGFEVTSSWLQEAAPANTTMVDCSPEYLAETATTDLTDITNSDLLVFFSQDPTTPHVRGGRHVEFGYALARYTPILVIGPQENVFHYLPARVWVRKSWGEGKTWLTEFLKKWRS